MRAAALPVTIARYILPTADATALASLSIAALTLACSLSSLLEADDWTVGLELPVGTKRKSRRASDFPAPPVSTPAARPRNPPIFFPDEAALRVATSVYKMYPHSFALASIAASLGELAFKATASMPLPLSMAISCSRKESV